MYIARRKYQGVWNIVRFNSHFYLIASLLFIVGFCWAIVGDSSFLASLFLAIVFVPIALSLVGSAWIYDFSDLYQMRWLPTDASNNRSILNLTAGFDESSQILMSRFPTSTVVACDFYNPTKHTERSIKSARKAYPPILGTLSVNTSELPFDTHSFDSCIAFFCLHEIRNRKERQQFMIEIARTLKPGSLFFVTEHLRDLPNLLAFSIGVFHFYSRKSWIDIFDQSGFVVVREHKTTAFVSTFELKKR